MKKIAVVGFGSIGSTVVKRIIHEDIQQTVVIIDAQIPKSFPDKTEIEQMIPIKEIKSSFNSKSKYHK